MGETEGVVLLGRDHQAIYDVHRAERIRGLVDIVRFLHLQTVDLVALLAVQVLGVWVGVTEVGNEAIDEDALRNLDRLIVGGRIPWLGAVVRVLAFLHFLFLNLIAFRVIVIIHLVLLLREAELGALTVLNITRHASIVIISSLNQIVKIVRRRILHWNGVNKGELLFYYVLIGLIRQDEKLFELVLPIRVLLIVVRILLDDARSVQVHRAVVANLLRSLQLLGGLRVLPVVVEEDLGSLLVLLGLAE